MILKTSAKSWQGRVVVSRSTLDFWLSTHFHISKGLNRSTQSALENLKYTDVVF